MFQFLNVNQTVKMRPIKNEHYFYKCEEYGVTGFTTMKSTLGVTLVEAVQYVRADDMENNPETYTQELQDFVNNFCPAKLDIGMQIIGVCMGRVIGNYSVVSVVEDQAWLAVDGEKEPKFKCDVNVKPNRMINITDGETLQAAYYYVEVNNTETALRNENMIENIRVMLIEASHRITNIERSSNNDAVQAVMTKLENQLKEIYKDFSI